MTKRSWDEVLSDVVLETGLPFETVVGFTQTQFMAIQEAIARRWEKRKNMSGISSAFCAPPARELSRDESTEAFEKKVQSMKKKTGKQSLDLWEVVTA